MASTKLSETLSALPTPPKENLTSHFILGEIIDQINSIQDDFPKVKIPLLRSHLWDIRNKSVNPETHLRGFLQVFEHTDIFNELFEELDEVTKIQIKAFIQGGREKVVLKAGGEKGAFDLPPSPPVKEHFCGLREKWERLISGEKVDGHGEVDGQEDDKIEQGSPRIFEDAREEKVMEVYPNQPFHNWGQSVSNTPLWTFVPRTILGLQNLVKWAKAQHLRVRCGGYRHSWSNVFSEDKHVLVSLLNLEQVTTLPDPMSIHPEYIDPENELKVIQLVTPTGVAATSTDKAHCRVGTAVTNEQFRRWAVKNNKWTLPVDVILVEVTIGGVNGPICHGAGRQHKTINDYIRAIEYVDANGVHRTISGPDHLRAAAGCFGLLGIVTHITFELDKMSYAILQPMKPDIGLAIPPLSRSDIPIPLRKTYTEAQYAAALTRFQTSIETSYYNEYFWFTRSQQAWINNFTTTPDSTGAIDYPSPFETWCQWVQGWLGHVITSSPIFNAFPGRWQAEILATMGMVNLPPFEFKGFEQGKQEKIKCALPDALHFRRGIQNMRVRDLEFQIPIPSLPNDPSKPDYSIIQRAWWDIINLTYQDDNPPMRLTLELRVMSDSNLIMAPQRGNKHGTASIEVLSVPDAVSDEEWEPFLQKVCDLWMGYKDGNGEPLNVRPHWAKEWEGGLKMRGLESRRYLKEVAYKDAIPEFREVLEDIGRGQGWELADLRKRFSNKLWDYLVFEIEE